MSAIEALAIRSVAEAFVPVFPRGDADIVRFHCLEPDFRTDAPEALDASSRWLEGLD